MSHSTLGVSPLSVITAFALSAFLLSGCCCPLWYGCNPYACPPSMMSYGPNLPGPGYVQAVSVPGFPAPAARPQPAYSPSGYLMPGPMPPRPYPMTTQRPVLLAGAGSAFSQGFPSGFSSAPGCTPCGMSPTSHFVPTAEFPAGPPFGRSPGQNEFVRASGL